MRRADQGQPLQSEQRQAVSAPSEIINEKGPVVGALRSYGGRRGTRTLGTRIFSPLLYQLSYPTGYAETVSVSTRAYILAGIPPRRKNFFYLRLSQGDGSPGSPDLRDEGDEGAEGDERGEGHGAGEEGIAVVLGGNLPNGAA